MYDIESRQRRPNASQQGTIMFVFNSRGFLMLAGAFAITFGATKALGIEDEGRAMTILGPLVMLLDLGYRMTSEDGHWIIPSRGGSLFFAPAWCFGALWLVLGLFYTLRPGLLN